MELVILIGLQGAGKSTFYRGRFSGTHDHVSKDNFSSSGNANRRQQRMVEEALRAGRSVVVDNTNPARVDREPLLQIARQCGASAFGYYFDSDLATCKRRNDLREGKARVPHVALHLAQSRMEKPSRDEGFERIFRVHTLDDGMFEVQPMEWEGPPDEMEAA